MPARPTELRPAQTENGRSSRTGGRVLLVVDDSEVGGILAYALRQMGLEPVRAQSAAEALAYWDQDTYALILIDVYGPGLDGIELVKRIRGEAANPILLFSMCGEESYAIRAYQAGADECIIKPISPPLFLAKVRAWLRYSWTVSTAALNLLEAGPFLLDTAQQAVVVDGRREVRLTNLEFRLLHLLMSHAGQVLPSGLIVDRVWGYGGGDSVLLKNVIYRLRRKLEPETSQPSHIQTVAGRGYAFY